MEVRVDRISPSSLEFHSPRTAMDERKKLRDLLAERALRFGDFVLSRGQRSRFIFDCKRVTLSAEGAVLVAEAFYRQIENLPEAPGAVGGETAGADPILGPLLLLAKQRGRNFDAFYTRKEPKNHGTLNQIENAPPPGSRVVIVDEVVTSGSSMIRAIEAARANGCQVLAAITLLDRLEQNGAQNVRERCSRYIPLFTLEDFRGEMEQHGVEVRARSSDGELRQA